MTLKEWMRKEGWTQGELAEALGLSQPYISYVVNRKVTPSLGVAMRLVALSKNKIQPKDLVRR